MFAIMATRAYTTPEGWHRSVQTPMFYLLANVQGILTATHAAKVGLDCVAVGHEIRDILESSSGNPDNVAALTAYDDTGTLWCVSAVRSD